MLSVICSVFIRIFSNSYLNVFQKFLTNGGQSSSGVNFYTYLGLMILILPITTLNGVTISPEIASNAIVMGLFGALGNYFIIKALSIGELSTLAPINSYKPIVAMLVAMVYLNEFPTLVAFVGIVFIIGGTMLLFDKKSSVINRKAVLYRVLALIFSGTEAIFIKKIIIMSDVFNAFVLWALAGFLFSAWFMRFGKLSYKISSFKYQGLLVLSVAIMQLATNYVFSKINVSYALALFQLSTLYSVILGVKIFNEGNLKRKLIASLAMFLGAVLIILG